MDYELNDRGRGIESIAESVKLESVEAVKARLGPEPLIVAINRSVVTLQDSPEGIKTERPPGGAASAVYDSLRKAGGGVVVATAITDVERVVAEHGMLFDIGENVWVMPIAVPQETFQAFYNEFANPALWLIHHRMAEQLIGRPGLVDLLRHPQHWLANYLPWTRAHHLRDLIFTNQVHTALEQGYRKVNRQYAKAIVTAFGDLPNARILIQDYHFYLLPAYIREEVGLATIAQFIHIPWESPAYLRRMVPEQVLRELIEGLLANDVIGFHTRSFGLQFMRSAKSVLSAEVDQKNGLVSYRGHTTMVATNPISIDVANLRQTALQGDTGAETQRYAHALLRRLEDKVLIGRWDRTDLSKGILEGLDALDLLLTRHANVRGNVVMLAILQPSRLDVPQYRNLNDRIRQRVEALNRKWSPNVGWNGLIENDEERHEFLRRLEHDDQEWQWPLTVVDFSNKPYSHVVGSQIAADVALINSLADGMNLVAKEYAVNNYPPFLRDFSRAMRSRFGRGTVTPTPGVIVGSNRMGAYAELRGALIAIDPVSVAETANGLQRAYDLQRSARLSPRSSPFGFLLNRFRRLSGSSPTVESLAQLASEQVVRNQLRDWMDRVLLDVELVQIPEWADAVRIKGIDSVRRTVQRGTRD